MAQRTLTARQVRAIGMMASGESDKAIAKSLSLSTRTLERWRCDPTFADSLRQAGDEVLRAALRVLAGNAGGAAQCLAELIDQADKDGDRIRAADVLLRHAAGMVTLIDLADRVSALEARQNDPTKSVDQVGA